MIIINKNKKYTNIFKIFTFCNLWLNLTGKIRIKISTKAPPQTQFVIVFLP